MSRYPGATTRAEVEPRFRCVVEENCGPEAVALAPQVLPYHSNVNGFLWRGHVTRFIYVPVCAFHLDGWFEGGDFPEDQSPPVIRLGFELPMREARTALAILANEAGDHRHFNEGGVAHLAYHHLCDYLGPRQG